MGHNYWCDDVERKIISQPALQINSVLYTAVTAHSCCYDLWKPESRKTPGTFFEILIGTTFSKVLSTYSRSKHIPIFQLVEAKAHFGVSAKNWEQLVNKSNLGKEDRSGSVAGILYLRRTKKTKDWYFLSRSQPASGSYNHSHIKEFLIRYLVMEATNPC